MRIVFLHGLESGPHGSKYRALAAKFPGVTSPDCQGVFDMEDRMEIILAHLEEGEPALLVGSSFGGLASALVCTLRPELVLGAVLCAPALHLPEAEGLSALGVPSVIIHGTEDEVVPIEASRAYSQRFLVPLVEVVDGHRLGGSVERILELVQSCIKQA